MKAIKRPLLRQHQTKRGHIEGIHWGTSCFRSIWKICTVPLGGFKVEVQKPR